jgi:uncharacterized OB-fold protein
VSEQRERQRAGAGPGVLVPETSEAGAPFWEATRRRELVLPWCTACGEPFWYPRESCPRCLADAIDWRAASGDGVVHAVSVQHRPGPGRSPDDGPYAVVLVDLAEGVRLMSNAVGCAPDEVVVGMPVRVTWLALPDGRNLPQFTPA